jgi:competence ComEA-like helix-hairpin-helix protein
MDQTSSYRVWRNRSIAIAVVTVIVIFSVLVRELPHAEVLNSDKRDLPSYSLDLNSASEAELNLLPGVGPKLAKEIVEYRDVHGNFSAIRDLQQVHGIGDGKFSTLERFVFVAR